MRSPLRPHLLGLVVLLGLAGCAAAGPQASSPSTSLRPPPIPSDAPPLPRTEAECSRFEAAYEAATAGEDRLANGNATFPALIGGLAGLVEQIEYPEGALRDGAQGRVFVTFYTDEYGRVVCPSVDRSVHRLLDREALRVVSNARFTPATVNREPVQVKFSLPVTFRLSTQRRIDGGPPRARRRGY